MEIRKGIAVSPGVAIAPAIVLDSEQFRITRRSIEPGDVEAELARFRGAVDRALAEVRELRQRVDGAADVPDALADHRPAEQQRGHGRVVAAVVEVPHFARAAVLPLAEAALLDAQGRQASGHAAKPEVPVAFHLDSFTFVLRVHADRVVHAAMSL